MTSLVSFVDNNKKKIGDFDKLPGGEARTQMLINLMMYLDSKSFIYFLKTSIFKNINNDKINAFINKIRYNLLIKNYKNKFPNDSPFICACKIGILENVKLLVNNVNDSKFLTVKEKLDQFTNRLGNGRLINFAGLIISVKKGHFDIIEYLIIDCGVDPSRLNEENWNALHFAVTNFYKYRKTNIIKLLLKHMSSDAINQKTTCLEETPLDFAYHHILGKNIIKLLRSNGCKAKNFDVNGKYVYGKGDLND
jgi:ankyrin repeat protein